MSKVAVPRHYWDANIFIWIIQGAVPAGEDINVLRDNFRMVDTGRLSVITSTFTLAEVVKGKPGNTALSASDEKNITAAFAGQYISLYDVSQRVAERARELQWVIPGIKPADAVHLATAEQGNADRFVTYDSKLIDRVEAILKQKLILKYSIGFPMVTNYSLPLP